MDKVQKNPDEACENLVLQNDKDRFYLYAALRTGNAPDILPLIAFNSEIAKTRTVVSDPTLGLIRLQWWRDSINAVYNGISVPFHEVLTPLAEVIIRYDLSKDDFMMMLAARERDMSQTPPQDMAALLDYAIKTTAPLNRLILKILGQSDTPDHVEAVSAGYALTGILRALPYKLSQDSAPLPVSLRQTYNLPAHAIDPEKYKEGIQAAVQEIHEQALVQFGVKPEARFMRASRALALTYLKRIRRYNYDVFDARVNNRPVLFLVRAVLNLF